MNRKLIFLLFYGGEYKSNTLKYNSYQNILDIKIFSIFQQKFYFITNPNCFALHESCNTASTYYKITIHNCFQ